MPPGDQLGQTNGEVRSAVRFAVMVAVVGVGFLILAALWVRTCTAGTATAACSPPERIILGLTAPMILFAGGIKAFIRTYQVWRVEGTWWGWQGAGWFLLMLALLTLVLGGGPITGPVLASMMSLTDK
ncbi:MAG: hypothetical protein K2Q25_14215 [Mycobacteriaceae bacterium]|nr:hypothetical protein [Mycobacteriaceae bacterium]